VIYINQNEVGYSLNSNFSLVFHRLFLFVKRMIEKEMKRKLT
jgi:hypothetical protein